MTDVRVTAGGETGRTFIYTDEPLSGAKYPRIQLEKVDNPTEVVDIGPNYMEHEYIFINCWVYSKLGFKVTISGTEYKNEQLVEYLFGNIGDTLKDKYTTMSDADVKEYRKINTTIVKLDPVTQLHYGAVTIKIAFWKR